MKLHYGELEEGFEYFWAQRGMNVPKESDIYLDMDFFEWAEAELGISDSNIGCAMVNECE